MYNKILKLRKNIDPSEFELQDDGSGVYISKWTSSEIKPTDAEIASVDDSKPTWIAAQEEIHRLEASITSRRLRDALASDEGKVWMDDVEKLIAVERGKL